MCPSTAVREWLRGGRRVNSPQRTAGRTASSDEDRDARRPAASLAPPVLRTAHPRPRTAFLNARARRTTRRAAELRDRGASRAGTPPGSPREVSRLRRK
ncbi:hypothetical protein SUDANB176_04642 [Streptomyces sp. enrichment culture]